MYGVPKFKEGFFMKYRKEVLLSVGAFLTIVTVVKYSPKQDIFEAKTIEASGVTIEQDAAVIGYKVVYNGADLGVIANEEDLDGILENAYNQLVLDLGYDPEVTPIPALIPIREGELTLDTLSIVRGLKDEIYASLDVVMQKAYVMRIGDDFSVTLESAEAVKEVLALAQSRFIKEDVALEIDLDVNEHNNLVMTPRVLMVDPNGSTVPLSTSGGGDTGTDEASVSDEEDSATDTQATEETQSTGTMVAIEFAEEIGIVEAFVNPADIVDVVTATEMITKENEEEKVYLVQSGDCPSTIASSNDMKLTELYKMNPGLKEKETSIHVGDPIVVMVPEPELKVETKVEFVYTQPIPKETTYTEDSSVYVGSSTVVDDGSDGTLEITALVTQLNGEEVGREITNEKVIVEPKNQVISKGSKPFPVKGATGSYIFPVSGYKISSPFGYRWGKLHTGVDLALSSGSAIVAADGGTVLFAGWKTSYGYIVEIDHGDGVTTRYAHCSSYSVEEGQAVSKGEQIAKVGSTGNSTGPHVHFEIRFNGVATNPLDYLE